MVLSLAGSAIALLVGRFNRKRSESDLRQIDRLIALADEALTAQTASKLKTSEGELSGIIAWFVTGQARGTADWAAFSIAISNAQHAIEKQHEAPRQDVSAHRALFTERPASQTQACQNSEP